MTASAILVLLTSLWLLTGGGGTLFIGLHNEAGGQGEILSVRCCDADRSEQGVPVALLLSRATRLMSSIEFESSFVINTFELDAIVRSSI